MTHVKMLCDYCPPAPGDGNSPNAQPRDWEMHPSWIAGMEAMSAYGDWVSSVVLPVAFQWIDEHRAEVYASIPENLKDDVGVVLAAALRLVKEQPAYQRGLEKEAQYETAVANGDSASINPVWTGIVKKIRTSTEEAFAAQASLLGTEEK